ADAQALGERHTPRAVCAALVAVRTDRLTRGHTRPDGRLRSPLDQTQRDPPHPAHVQRLPLVLPRDLSTHSTQVVVLAACSGTGNPAGGASKASQQHRQDCLCHYKATTLQPCPTPFWP